MKIRHSQFTDALWEGLTDPNCGQLMGPTAENLVEEFNLTRQQQDEFAVQSHKKAAQAHVDGKFAGEIVPVEVKKKKEKVLLTADETINPDLTVETAGTAPAVFKEDGGTVTPVNACGICDGASAMLIMTADKAKELGFTPLAKIVSYGYAGVEPQRMGIAPAGAVPKAFDKAGLILEQMDLIEINEAFAGQVLSSAQNSAGIGPRSMSTAGRLRLGILWGRRVAESS